MPDNSTATLTPHDAARAILERFGSRDGKTCNCCVHEADGGKHTPSMSVTVVNGKLLVKCWSCTQAAVIDELRNLGLWPEKPKREPIKVWNWWTARGKKRAQKLWELGGRKFWSKNQGPSTPKPIDLLYTKSSKDGFPKGPAAIIFAEGPTSTDALCDLGFRAVGHFAGKTNVESMSRFNPKAECIVWPDHDPSGYTQMDRIAETMLECGFTVRAIDPLRINPDAPRKFDPRNWKPGADVRIELEQAIVELGALSDRPRSGVQLITDWSSAAGIEHVFDAIGWRHRRNTRTGGSDIQRDDGPWEELTDDLECLARTTLIPAKCASPAGKDDEPDKPIRIGKDSFYDSLNAHGALTRVDPLIERVEDLPDWDGEHRNWICGCWPSTADNVIAQWGGMATLIAIVRLAYEPGSQQDETLILAGSQEAGKTSAFREMFWPDLSDMYDVAPPMDCKRQELQEACAGPAVLEFGELAGMHRADLARLKGWLTATKDRGRGAYKRNVTSRKRTCITVGTVDQRDQLPVDPAGMRRFPLVKIKEGRGQKAHVSRWWAENRDQIWAEALARYRHGEDHHPPAWLIPIMADAADEYRKRDDAVEDALDEYLGTLPPGHPVEFNAALKAIKVEGHGIDGRLQRALKLAGYESDVIRLPDKTQVRRWVLKPLCDTPVTPLSVHRWSNLFWNENRYARDSTREGASQGVTDAPERTFDPEPPRPEPVRLDQGETAHARDVARMADAMNPDPREPSGPEPEPVPAPTPLLDRPLQPHVDHVPDLGSPFATPPKGETMPKTPCVSCGKPTGVERVYAEEGWPIEPRFDGLCGACMGRAMMEAALGRPLTWRTYTAAQWHARRES